MAEFGSKTYLGGKEVLTYVGNKIVAFNPTSVVPEPTYAFRTDTYAGSLELALPGANFTSLGMSNYYDDVHADIKGSGTNIAAAITGSTFEIDSSDIKWSSEGYDSSMRNADAGQWGGVQDSTWSFGSSDWVIEGWVYMNERFTKPPFWKVGIRHADYYISCEMGFSTSGDAGFLKGRIILDTSTTTQSQYISSDVAFNLNQWYHVAWVRNGNDKYFYFDGTRYLNNTSAIGSIDTNGGFIRVLRGENTTNDGTDGNWQDFRVYIGTDKGYTGSTITTPDSIIEQT